MSRARQLIESQLSRGRSRKERKVHEAIYAPKSMADIGDACLDISEWLSDFASLAQRLGERGYAQELRQLSEELEGLAEEIESDSY